MARITRLAVLAVCVLAVLVPAAAAGLGPTITLVGPLAAGQSVIAAASANGYEAFAWLRGGAGGYVQARVRRPNGTLTAIERVSPADAHAYQPAIAVDRSGAATIAWLAHVHGLAYAVEV